VSRSVDLFIASARPIEDVAEQVAGSTGLALGPGEVPGTWALDQGTVHAELRAHPYVDDGDLSFERYAYALSARVPNGSRTSDSAEANLLRMVAESIRKAGLDSLLVHDLQYRDGAARPAGPVEPGDPPAGPAPATGAAAP